MFALHIVILGEKKYIFSQITKEWYIVVLFTQMEKSVAITVAAAAAVASTHLTHSSLV
jgi:hypothetical protein